MFSILEILLVVPFLFRHIALPRGVLKRGKHFNLTCTESNLMMLLPLVCWSLSRKTKRVVWVAMIPFDLLRGVIRIHQICCTHESGEDARVLVY